MVEDGGDLRVPGHGRDPPADADVADPLVGQGDPKDHVAELGHADRERAVREAKQLASDLLGMYAAAAPPVAPGRGTLRQVFARFERDAVPHVRALQAREDRRRLAIWTAFLGPDAELGGWTRPRLIDSSGSAAPGSSRSRTTL